MEEKPAGGMRVSWRIRNQWYSFGRLVVEEGLGILPSK
jgi:hypothetical protein